MIIPKIELTITANELKETYAALDFDMPEITYTGEPKQKLASYYSLLEAIRIKLAKKILSHKDKKKPFKITLEYYEAHCLHRTLIVVRLGHYAQSLFNQLDQKLA